MDKILPGGKYPQARASAMWGGKKGEDDKTRMGDESAKMLIENSAADLIFWWYHTSRRTKKIE